MYSSLSERFHSSLSATRFSSLFEMTLADLPGWYIEKVLQLYVRVWRLIADSAPLLNLMENIHKARKRVARSAFESNIRLTHIAGALGLLGGSPIPQASRK